MVTDRRRVRGMIPVLAVNDPETARRALADYFDFKPTDDAHMKLGDQKIAIVRAGDRHSGLIEMRLDHIALRTFDADATRVRLEMRGAILSRDFTPEGPRDISEFWDFGVRFVFFDGPEGWPLEFCARNGISSNSRSEGHDHIAIRTKDLDAVEARLDAFGATRVAEYKIEGDAAPVFVRFLRTEHSLFELFTEPEFRAPTSGSGWIGLLRE